MVGRLGKVPIERHWTSKEPVSLDTLSRERFSSPDRARIQDEAIASAIGRTKMHI